MRGTFEVKNKIMDMTTPKVYPLTENVYKETLRELLNVFGQIYYIDGNGNKTRVNCAYGDQERSIGKLKKDNTLILPYITISQQMTVNDDERRRYHPILISEKSWDPKKKRAIRVLSLAPRPINIYYGVNIWTKYTADMDIIRSTIFNMFNPDLNIRTKFSDFNKCFLEQEEDTGAIKVGDADDRVLRKSITVMVETYIPSPKFMFTSTGEITEFNQEYKLQDSSSDSPESVRDNLTTIPTD